VRRAILSPVLLAAALALQLTVVNRLPLPGTGPDLVLLTVVALSLCGGPAAGAVTGFGAGLALDIAPPGSYLIGEYALVFCVVGYLCGRLRGSLNNSALLIIALAMAAAAAGEGGSVVLGVVLSDPQVTWSAVGQVLPPSVVYDVAVTPFLLYGVLRAVRWADALGRSVPGERQADGAALLAREVARGGTALQGRPAGRGSMLGGAGLLGGSGWLAGPIGSSRPRGPRGYRAPAFASSARKGAAVHIPSTPRLRQAAARRGDGWLGGGSRTGLAGPAQRRPGRPPRLRPAAGVPGSAAARPPRILPRSPANLRINSARRRDGNVGRGVGRAAAAGIAGSARRGTGPPGSAFRSRRPQVGAAAGLAGSARRGTGPPGSAFRSRGPQVGAAAGRSRVGAPAHAPRFRRDARLGGGSSSPEMLRARTLRSASLRTRTMRGAALRTRTMRGAALRTRTMRGAALRTRATRGTALSRSRRMRPARGVTLHLRTGRRHDGVLGGGALGGRETVGLSGLRGGGLRRRLTRSRGARSFSLRLGSGRRGDGTLGGGALTKGRRAVRSRPARPRFRSGPAVGGRSLLGRRADLGVTKRVRFSSGRTPLLAALGWRTHGRLGRRSAVWRIGSRRTGGLR
jgi:rod shape-determining protein MreD